MFHFILDVGPLQESNYTGIAQVTRQLAASIHNDKTIISTFTYADYILPTEIVESLLSLQTGKFFKYHFQSGGLNLPLIDYNFIKSHNNTVGIFPNVKQSRCKFPFEAQIFHDLSTLLTPEFHTDDAIFHHIKTIKKEVETDDLIFSVSSSTKNDLIKYLKVPEEKIVVAHLGFDIIDTQDNCIKGDQTINFSPYFLFLGTLEPRKNIEIIFKFIRKNPWLLENFYFVIAGGKGWKLEIKDMMEKFNLYHHVASGRIKILNFVTEIEKNILLKNAFFSIYPSWFEGFGLPVLESLAHGVPVVTSFTSSLPEVGGDVAYYFSPEDEDSLFYAISELLHDCENNISKLKSECKLHALNFSWDRFYEIVKNSIIERAAGQRI